MPEIADTPLGPIEFETRGSGRPVLVVHGSPGGWDQAAAMAQFLPADEFRAVLPSRPGYLGTPLEGRETIDAQADLHAALLDHLGIERTGVLCWSGGGPSSYRLAVRHPARVGAIVALAAVSLPLDAPAQGLDSRFMFRTAPGNWLLRVLGAHAPERLIAATLAAEGDLTKAQVRMRAEEVFADEAKRRFVLALDETVTQRDDRRRGLDNDFAQFAAIDDLELERISVPTLLVWGDVDSDVPPRHSEHAAAAIAGADALPLTSGTHLAFYCHPDSAVAQSRALALLRG